MLDCSYVNEGLYVRVRAKVRKLLHSPAHTHTRSSSSCSSSQGTEQQERKKEILSLLLSLTSDLLCWFSSLVCLSVSFV